MSLDDALLDDISLSEADVRIPSPAQTRRADDARHPGRRGDPDAPADTPAPVVPAATDPDAPVCLAFQGVGGGAGTTSLAIGVAQSLRARTGRGVCVVDLDFELGTCAGYLDVEPGARAEDFAVDPGRVDATFVRALLAEHPGGLNVLAAEPGAAAVNPATVLAVLDVLSDMFGVLVLDVPRGWQPWTDAVLRAADQAVLVGELHIPALHRARGQVDKLEAAGVRAGLVLSKYERRSFKASLRRADAEKALARPVLGVVATDPHTAAECVNCGEPVVRLSPEGRLAKDVEALALALVPVRADSKAKRKVRRR